MQSKSWLQRALFHFQWDYLIHLNPARQQNATSDGALPILCSPMALPTPYLATGSWLMPCRHQAGSIELEFLQVTLWPRRYGQLHWCNYLPLGISYKGLGSNAEKELEMQVKSSSHQANHRAPRGMWRAKLRCTRNSPQCKRRFNLASKDRYGPASTSGLAQLAHPCTPMGWFLGTFSVGT